MSWLPSRQAPGVHQLGYFSPVLLDYRNNLGGSGNNPTPLAACFLPDGLLVCTQIAPEGVPGGAGTNSLGCIQRSPHSFHGGLLVLDPWGDFKLSTESVPANSTIKNNNNTYV